LRSIERPFGQLARPEAEQAYTFSRFAVGRLLDEIGGAALANLLRDLGDGVAFEMAFERRAQRAFRDFEADLAGH
jgi:hypothetical protein